MSLAITQLCLYLPSTTELIVHQELAEPHTSWMVVFGQCSLQEPSNIKCTMQSRVSCAEQCLSPKRKGSRTIYYVLGKNTGVA